MGLGNLTCTIMLDAPRLLQHHAFLRKMRKALQGKHFNLFTWCVVLHAQLGMQSKMQKKACVRECSKHARFASDHAFSCQV